MGSFVNSQPQHVSEMHKFSTEPFEILLPKYDIRTFIVKPLSIISEGITKKDKGRTTNAGMQ
jgi:hypothetical protein